MIKPLTYVIFCDGSLGYKTSKPYYKFMFMFKYGLFMLHQHV